MVCVHFFEFVNLGFVRICADRTQRTVGHTIRGRRCGLLCVCYLGADGARVLSFSARLNKDAFKRLVETGNFLKAVLNHDNWSEGKIFAICIKVRLLHASIRYFILKSDRWDMKWGYPINQEDLVGTNLAFSQNHQLADPISPFPSKQ